jgi:hypothetical protein
MRRSVLTAAVISGLLMVALSWGCKRAVVQPPGGSAGSKSERARKQAEAMALNVVDSVAKAQARAIPELAKGNGSNSGGIVVIAPSDGNFVSPKPLPPVTPQPIISYSPASGSSMKDLPGKGSDGKEESGKISSIKDFSNTKSSPRPGSPAIIKVRVKSTIAYVKEGDAEDDALNQARDDIEQQLANLDPPVRYKPSLNEVKNEFARKDSRTVRPLTSEERAAYDKAGIGIDKKLVFVEYDIEVTADQIRELRTRDRVGVTLRLFGGVMFIALASFLFLRADDWTKGYLTRWLAFGAVALVGGAAIALYFV